MKVKDRSTKLFAIVMAVGMLGAIWMAWPANRASTKRRNGKGDE